MFEKESLSCLYAYEHFDNFLYGNKFKIRTDHKAPAILLDNCCQSQERKPKQIQHWFARFNMYNYVLEYRANKYNC